MSPASRLPAMPDNPGDDPEPGSGPSPDAEPTQSGNGQGAGWISDWRLWAGIGLVIALAAGLIAWRAGRRPAESEPAPPPPGLDRDTVPMPPTAAAPEAAPPPAPVAAAPRPDDIPTAGRLPEGARRLQLTLVSGAGPRGQVYELQVARPVVIGRGQSCALSIPGDDEISRNHAQIESRDGRLVILDLDSTHGTFVNGVPVRHERLLEPGDILRLGRTELKLSF
jgi:hypothetical protein